MVSHNTPLKDLIVIEPKVFEDDRGYFFESYNKDRFQQAGLFPEFIQDNQSLSQKGVLRGMHLQNQPWAQGKLVRVIKGAVLDVAVDVRNNSETFGKNFSIVLSGDKGSMRKLATYYRNITKPNCGFRQALHMDFLP